MLRASLLGSFATTEREVLHHREAEEATVVRGLGHRRVGGLRHLVHVGQEIVEPFRTCGRSTVCLQRICEESFRRSTLRALLEDQESPVAWVPCVDRNEEELMLLPLPLQMSDQVLPLSRALRERQRGRHPRRTRRRGSLLAETVIKYDSSMQRRSPYRTEEQSPFCSKWWRMRAQAAFMCWLLWIPCLIRWRPKRSVWNSVET